MVTEPCNTPMGLSENCAHAVTAAAGNCRRICTCEKGQLGLRDLVSL